MRNPGSCFNCVKKFMKISSSRSISHILARPRFQVEKLGNRQCSVAIETGSNNKGTAVPPWLRVAIEEPQPHPLAVQLASLYQEVAELEAVCKDTSEDNELRSIAKNDVENLKTDIKELSVQFLKSQLPACEETLVEVSAGVGGQESMLFASDLFQMYIGLAQYNGWPCQVVQYDENDIGGLRHGTLDLKGFSVFSLMFLESGVHRVQRIPKTEKSGRVHTSTATVSVLPTPQKQSIEDFPPNTLKIETKKASGAGGQHVNTTESAVRVTHLPTGVTVECQMERSQIQNRTLAIKMLRTKLYNMELEKKEKEFRDKKKELVGEGMRSDRIRTYNFMQDRITDHRYGGVTVHRINDILRGGSELEKFIQLLWEKKTDMLLNDKT